MHTFYKNIDPFLPTIRLSDKELIPILQMPDAADRCVGGHCWLEARQAIFIRGNRNFIGVSFYELNRIGVTQPEQNFNITDNGTIIKFGDVSIPFEDLLYTWAPDYYNRKQKEYLHKIEAEEKAMWTDMRKRGLTHLIPPDIDKIN